MNGAALSAKHHRVRSLALSVGLSALLVRMPSYSSSVGVVERGGGAAASARHHLHHQCGVLHAWVVLPSMCAHMVRAAAQQHSQHARRWRRHTTSPRMCAQGGRKHDDEGKQREGGKPLLLLTLQRHAQQLAACGEDTLLLGTLSEKRQEHAFEMLRVEAKHVQRVLCIQSLHKRCLFYKGS